jgi:hypothetical protein
MRGGKRVRSYVRKGASKQLRQIKKTNVVFVRPDGTVQVRTMVPKMKKAIVMGMYKKKPNQKMTVAQKLMAMSKK